MLTKRIQPAFITFAILLGVLFAFVSHAGGKHHAPHFEHKKQISDEHDEEIVISKQNIKKAGILLLTAGPHEITLTKKVVGKIVPNANKTVYIYPRYNGLIKALKKQLGEHVQNGELLAIIESNDSLQKYQIKAPFSGLIVKKLANTGEQIEIKSPIYQLSDLSTVWCDLYIYRKNAKLIKKGQRVVVIDEGHSTESVITYVSPLGIEHNQTMLARVELDNKPNTWMPGMYVQVLIDIKTINVPIAVNQEAIQTVEGEQVVFVRTKGGFKAAPCRLGMRGKQFIEVQGCLKPGQAYASHNSYLIKAHLEKEGASHEH